MKALVAGLVLIVLSGAALLWQRTRDNSPPLVAPHSTSSGMVWKAHRGKATVWLCGSIHLLREHDYPLPESYRRAFEEAKTVVMELPPGSARDQNTQRITALSGSLPQGQTLETTVSARTWAAIDEWSRKAGKTTAAIQDMKPWMAALTISIMTYERLGFSTSRGMESYFTARLGDRKSEGLETAELQFHLFNDIDAKTQEEMILQAIDEEKTAEDRVEQLALAWRTGDANRLAALMDEGMSKFPAVKKLLLDDRHAAWIPVIEKHLDGDETVMILVGSGHLAGRSSVIDLLERNGVTVTQMRR